MDANQFVADEDDVTYSCRVSGKIRVFYLLLNTSNNNLLAEKIVDLNFDFTGALLLEEVVSVSGTEGINAIMDAAKEQYCESQREKAAGSALWWRVSREDYFLLVKESSRIQWNGQGLVIFKISSFSSLFK